MSSDKAPPNHTTTNKTSPRKVSPSRAAVALLAGVAVAALSVTNSSMAAGHGGGGGFHGGGGGFHGFAGHGFAGHGFAGHGIAGHGFAGHGFAGHAVTGHGAAAINHGFAAHAVGGEHGLGRGDFAHNGEFAHNHFAARNFHGLYNFDPHGFNRNAFGEGRAWNHWGGRFWGAGWNQWGGGWGGWAGPVFWPFLFGDALSFAFWPYGYYDPFWAMGPDFLLGSIFAPGPYFGQDYGYAGTTDVYYGATPADRQALEQTNAEAAQGCAGMAPGVTDFPIAQFRKAIQPTADQAALLDDLQTATQKAGDIVKASCPTAVPLAPVARLDAAEQRLTAMSQAVDVVRGPLEKLYDSLNDEQKQRFDKIGSAAATQARPGTPAGGDLAALCGQQPGEVAKLPVQRIEQVVQPSAQQQASFEGLQQASQKVAEDLQASCPKEMPQGPVARLDAVKTRLGAMVDAMKTVRPKLAAFYGSLGDEQKAKFNTMAPAANAG